MRKSILAIIPARGGSKGIFQKNIKNLCGKPLIAWSIEEAKKSAYITRIIVSTDDDQIKKISDKFGAEVVRRPHDISGDEATSESALLHVLNKLQIEEEYTPDIIVFLQCTSPFTLAEDIDKCIEKFIKENADSATTVTNFHYFIWKEKQDNVIGINHDKNFRARRQDKEKQFLETGAVYVMRSKGFLESKHRFFGKTVLSEMPAERVMEIDEPIDFEIAEIRMQKYIHRKIRKELPDKIDAVVFDFDGVMTDDKVYITENGIESVVCSRSDGMGITLLKKVGIKIAVFSTEVNPIVGIRCKKLGIEYHQGLGLTKLEALKNWTILHKINMENIIYIGNDINDKECLKSVGYAVIPADAHVSVIPYANMILKHRGGHGAVREICDIIMTKKDIL